MSTPQPRLLTNRDLVGAALSEDGERLADDVGDEGVVAAEGGGVKVPEVGGEVQVGGGEAAGGEVAEADGEADEDAGDEGDGLDKVGPYDRALCVCKVCV